MRPRQPRGVGALVLAGSSGRVDLARAQLLAAHGITALPLQWFGGPGQRPAAYEVPIEEFTTALDHLCAECDRVTIVGTSFGAEAALVTATIDPRVAAVVALAPSAVVWAGFSDDEGWSSHWTWQARPLPYLPFTTDWTPADPPAFLEWYRQSLAAATPAQLGAATIPVERIAGPVVLVVGGDDLVWPSSTFADMMKVRRDQAGRTTWVLTDNEAGHRTVLPGEPVVQAGQTMQRGGTPEADERLGRQVWPIIRAALLDEPIIAPAE